MEKIENIKKIYVAESKISGAGRGVFADEDILKGEVIEICPVIDISEGELASLNETNLVTYLFYYGEKLERAFICLGFGSIYNHSYQPNAKYEIFESEKKMDFVSLDDIKKGEEISVDYNRGKKNDSPLWFE